MNNPVGLKEISKWGESKSEVSLPALQRGFVWSPRQVEFLWDSVLRSFPIGGFVLSENADKTFYLMDGQQRFSAIKAGFEEPNANCDSMLWIDVKPSRPENSTRAYFVKATTKIHPWGFKNDDNSSTLNAEERREALREFDMGGKNIFKDNISILDTFPVMSNLPIPLSYLLNAPLNSEESFVSFIIEKLDVLSSKWKEKVKWQERQTRLNVKMELENYFPVIKGILGEKSYAIPFSILPISAMSSETEALSNQTNLEILFTRLNKGGTPISNGDLYYSAIKAYWGDEFKLRIDKLAKDRMPAQTLAMLILRLAMTVKDVRADKFIGNLSIKQIRNYARDNESKEFVEKFVEEHSEQIIKSVDTAFCGLPKYLVMKIISERSDIYLLLLYLAYKKIDLNKLKISSLAIMLYWFALDVAACVNELFLYFASVEPTLDGARKIISQLTVSEKIRVIYEPDELRSAVNPLSLQRPNIETPLEQFWELVSNSQRKDLGFSLIVFAEKDFLNELFPNYIPARVKDWDKTNRPWDYDHIIPQSWSYNQSKSNPYKIIADYWLWRNGNFAAVPFEENRSKNDAAEYAFYERNEEELLFSKEVESVHREFLRDKAQAENFARLTFERSIRIYKKCYDYILPCLPIFCDVVDERKRFFDDLQKKLHGFKMYFVLGNKEYEIQSYNDWERKCLTFAYEVNSVCMLAVTWNMGFYQQYSGKEMLEIGFRKHHSINTTDNDFFMKIQESSANTQLGLPLNMNEWWYTIEEINVDENIVFEKLNQLITFSKNELEECSGE